MASLDELQAQIESLPDDTLEQIDHTRDELHSARQNPEGYGSGNMQRQRILDAITDLTDQKGYPPTVREIGRAVNLSSTATFHHLETLEEQKRIAREPGIARTIRVVV